MDLPEIKPLFLILFIISLSWGMVWKGIGLWKAGRNNQSVWFILIFVFNTLGILPIVYLLFFQKNEEE